MEELLAAIDSVAARSRVVIASSGTLSSSRVVISPFMVSRASATIAYCMTPARFTTLKSSLDKTRHHRASRHVESTNLRIHLNVSWPVQIVTLFSFKYVRKKRKAHIFARHSR